MRVQMIWEYYPGLLKSFYGKHSEVMHQPFAQHRRSILDEHYGWPGELCDYMTERGIESSFVVGNDERMQKKWAKEQGFTAFGDSTWEADILLAQIRSFRPDVLWLNCTLNYNREFVREASCYAGKLITWIGSPLSKDVDLPGYSALVTENPLTLRSRHHLFEKVVVTKPGFDGRIVKRIGTVEKKREVTFVGQISGAHTWRAELLRRLMENGIGVDVFAFFTPGGTPPWVASSRLLFKAIRYGQGRQAARLLKLVLGLRDYARDRNDLARHSKEPVFGLDMYRVMAESRIVVNVHGDVVGDNAGNMRMFECTGVGSCLITEAKGNLSSLFEPEEEVLTYDGTRSLVQKIKEALRHPERTAAVARAGQMRTLRDHTLERMFNDIQPALTG